MKSRGKFFSVIGCLAASHLVAEESKSVEFPIVAWNMIDESVPVLGNFKDPQKFKTMKECGFNTVCMIPPTLLPACQEAGLKAWVYDPELYRSISNADKSSEAILKGKLEALVKQGNQSSATRGYVLQDEPSAKLFPVLKKASDLFAQASGGKSLYVNLFPNYAPVAALGVPTYAQYVEEYISVCKPSFLAYDFYGLEDTGRLREGYWKNMEVVYQAAKKANLPVYPVILSVTGLNFRELEEEDILFQIFTHLAHGAKGIQYFTYFTPAYSNFRNAPIDQFGNKTPMWWILKRVNQRLGALAPVLSTLKWQRCYHVGVDVPTEVSDSGVTPESLVQGAQCSEGAAEVFVGEFKGPEDSTYVMIVNKEKKSINLEVQWKEAPQGVQEIMRSHGTPINWGAGENAWMGPSEGVLLRVE